MWFVKLLYESNITFEVMLSTTVLKKKKTSTASSVMLLNCTTALLHSYIWLTRWKLIFYNNLSDSNTKCLFKYVLVSSFTMHYALLQTLIMLLVFFWLFISSDPHSKPSNQHTSWHRFYARCSPWRNLPVLLGQ